MRSVIAKLAEAGYVTINGEDENVYPTVAAITPKPQVDGNRGKADSG